MSTEYQDKPVADVKDKPADDVATRGKESPDLSKEELEAQGGEQLPDREAMSLINANIAVPVNAAVAANVLSDNATAIADAQQGNNIGQGA